MVFEILLASKVPCLKNAHRGGDRGARGALGFVGVDPAQGLQCELSRGRKAHFGKGVAGDKIFHADLGLAGDSTHRVRPELHFNIVIVRRFLNAFIVHVVPIFTVTILLYAILLTITTDRSRAETRGFNITGTIGIIAALFFVVMVSHVHVREQFASERIVYIEGFFLTALGAVLFAGAVLTRSVVTYRRRVGE